VILSEAHGLLVARHARPYRQDPRPSPTRRFSSQRLHVITPDQSTAATRSPSGHRQRREGAVDGPPTGLKRTSAAPIARVGEPLYSGSGTVRDDQRHVRPVGKRVQPERQRSRDAGGRHTSHRVPAGPSLTHISTTRNPHPKFRVSIEVDCKSRYRPLRAESARGPTNRQQSRDERAHCAESMPCLPCPHHPVFTYP
jgi:hypothetical protein